MTGRSRALFPGLSAGLTALALDHLLAYATTGVPLPVSGIEIWLAYGLTGAVLALVISALQTPETPWIGPVAFAGLYVLPIAERLSAVGLGQLPRSVVVTLTWQVVAVVLVSVIVAALLMTTAGYWLSHRAGNVGIGTALAGSAAAMGLAINRGAVAHPLEPMALAADALVVLWALATAELCRRADAKRLALVAAVAVGFAAIWLGLRPDEPTLSVTASADSEDQPNLILLVVDTLRADVFERVIEETPEGREFARHFADAAWFTNAQASSPWTAPSMGSILTGLYPAEHGFGGVTTKRDLNRTLRPMSEAAVPLTLKLANRGYSTEAILANPILFPGCGLDRGFERYEILSSNIKRLPLPFVFARIGLLQIHAYQDAAEVNRHIKRRLDDWSRSDRPLFLWLHYLDPHKPMQRHPHLPEDPTAQSLDEEQRLYRDETRFALVHVSRAVERLKETGLWQNSLVVFASDHGELMHADQHEAPMKGKGGNFLRHGHGKALYQGLTRVPLILKPPGGLDAKKDVDALVSHTDIYDTAVDVLELDIPRIGQDRTSLAPWLIGSDSAIRRRSGTLLGGIQAGIPQKGLVTESHKLIVYKRERPPELYDLKTDPKELEDLSDQTDLGPWIEELEIRWSQLRSLKGQAPAELDQETRERLKSLGYLQ